MVVRCTIKTKSTYEAYVTEMYGPNLDVTLKPRPRYCFSGPQQTELSTEIIRYWKKRDKDQFPPVTYTTKVDIDAVMVMEVYQRGAWTYQGSYNLGSSHFSLNKHKVTANGDIVEFETDDQGVETYKMPYPRVEENELNHKYMDMALYHDDDAGTRVLNTFNATLTHKYRRFNQKVFSTPFFYSKTTEPLLVAAPTPRHIRDAAATRGTPNVAFGGGLGNDGLGNDATHVPTPPGLNQQQRGAFRQLRATNGQLRAANGQQQHQLRTAEKKNAKLQQNCDTLISTNDTLAVAAKESASSSNESATTSKEMFQFVKERTSSCV